MSDLEITGPNGDVFELEITGNDGLSGTWEVKEPNVALHKNENKIKAEGIEQMSAKFFLNGIPFTEENVDSYAKKLRG